MTIKRLVLLMIVLAIIGLGLIFAVLTMYEKKIVEGNVITIVSIIVAPVFITGFIVGIIADRTIEKNRHLEETQIDNMKGKEK